MFLMSYFHSYRKINNVLQNRTKQKLQLFFVDLELTFNNFDIFNINILYMLVCYTKIKVEEPHVKIMATLKNTATILSNVLNVVMNI